MTVVYANVGDNLTTLLKTLAPGDTLSLNDGTYTRTGANVLDCSGVNGTPDAWITIRATHDGKAILDGQHQTTYGTFPLFMDSCSYIAVNGLVLQNGQQQLLITGVSGTPHDIIVGRCTAHDSQSGNYHVFNVLGSTNRPYNILLEDCAGWGVGRYIFGVYHADTVRLRRCWAHWQSTGGTTAGAGPYACFNIYGSTNVTYENGIGQGAYPAISDTSPYNAMFQTSDGPADTGAQWLGCFLFNCWSGLQLNASSGGSANTLLRDVVFYNIVQQGTGTTTLTHGDAIQDQYVSGTTDTYDHVTIVTSDDTGIHKLGASAIDLSNSIIEGTPNAIYPATIASHVHNDYYNNTTNGVTPGPTEQTVNPAFDTATYGLGAYLMGPTAASLLKAATDGRAIGAEVLYEYVDGALTTTPLWPWPMESRILAEHSISPTNQIWTTLNGVYPVTPEVPQTMTKTLSPDSRVMLDTDFSNPVVQPVSVEATSRESVLLYSANYVAETATFTDPAVIDTSAVTYLQIFLAVKAFSGTTPTLKLNLLFTTPDGVAFVIYGDSASTASGFIDIGPGTANNIIVPLNVQLQWVIAGTTPSFTFDVYVYGFR